MNKPKTGIAVDGACSGNPGPAEYRIVDIASGKTLVHRKIGIGTNNHAEFIGLCHAIALYPDQDIYCDSKTAISWVEKRRSNSSMDHPDLARCDNYLKKLTKLPKVIKWQTKLHGEIPADFGRKQ